MGGSRMNDDITIFNQPQSKNDCQQNCLGVARVRKVSRRWMDDCFESCEEMFPSLWSRFVRWINGEDGG